MTCFFHCLLLGLLAFVLACIKDELNEIERTLENDLVEALREERYK